MRSLSVRLALRLMDMFRWKVEIVLRLLEKKGFVLYSNTRIVKTYIHFPGKDAENIEK